MLDKLTSMCGLATIKRQVSFPKWVLIPWTTKRSDATQEVDSALLLI